MRREGKLKCREYNACKRSCIECDLISNKKCDIEVNLETPKKYINVKRRDCGVSWNECPTCGFTIGYRPDLKDYRCKCCRQKISWK